MRRCPTALAAMASINDRAGKHANGANQWGACAPVVSRGLKMRCKTLARLFAVSVIILTGSPALATQIGGYDVHRSSSEQKAGACRHRPFGTCVAGESCAPHCSGVNITHDGWPANMILG
jgi:hypothetical protein